MNKLQHTFSLQGFCAAIASISFLWLAWSFFSLAIYKQNAINGIKQTEIQSTIVNELSNSKLPNNILTQESKSYSFAGVKARLSLESQSEQLKHNIEASHWRTDRQFYSKKLLEIEKQILLSQVNNGYAWLDLLGIQFQLNKPKREIFWSLNQSLELNGWDENLLATHGFYCVYYWHELPIALKDNCGSAIEQLIRMPNYLHQQELSSLDKASIEKVIAAVQKKRNKKTLMDEAGDQQ